MEAETSASRLERLQRHREARNLLVQSTQSRRPQSAHAPSAFAAAAAGSRPRSAAEVHFRATPKPLKAQDLAGADGEVGGDSPSWFLLSHDLGRGQCGHGPPAQEKASCFSCEMKELLELPRCRARKHLGAPEEAHVGLSGSRECLAGGPSPGDSLDARALCQREGAMEQQAPRV